MIPPPDCSVREDDPCVDVPSYQDEYRGGYEPDWEDLAYDLAREREFEETVCYIRESERQLRDYNKYTDRQLRNISKESKSLACCLWGEYRFDVAAGCFEVSHDSEYYFTVSRDGVPHTPHTLTRKDKQRMKKNLRKRERQLGILTKRGCSPRQVKGYEGGSFTTVVAAT
jgi:hypothetical protein